MLTDGEAVGKRSAFPEDQIGATHERQLAWKQQESFQEPSGRGTELGQKEACDELLGV